MLANINLIHILKQISPLTFISSLIYDHALIVSNLRIYGLQKICFFLYSFHHHHDIKRKTSTIGNKPPPRLPKKNGPYGLLQCLS